jgi:hypothetical protein
VIKLRLLAPVLVLAAGGCVPPIDPGDYDPVPRPMPSVTRSAQRIGPDEFWALIEDARARAQNDTDRMAAALDHKFYDANDETISSFQDQLAAASTQLYTWRHGEAAELICGGLDADAFAVWRYWVIAQGRAVFDRAVADPDSLADVDNQDDGCDLWFEPVGSAASTVWFERHPKGDPELANLDFLGDPSGTRLHGSDAIRAALPRLAAEN